MILELKHVTKDYDGLRAVDDVSLIVEQGKIVGLIGPNGSGKSTLLSVIAGATAPTAGEIIFAGHDITRASANHIFDLGLVRGFQDPSLFFQMTVLDNVLLPIKNQRGEHPWYAPLKRTWREEEQVHSKWAHSVLRQVELDNHFGNLASDLSGGQMKLLEIARCLMGDPKMLLLDEPTAGVAPKLAYDIFQHIDRMCQETEITFLIVEHRLELLLDFVDYVYVMHMGSILAQGTPDEIVTNDTVRTVYMGN